MRLVYIYEAVGLHLRPFLCADGKTLVWSGLSAYLGLLWALCWLCWNGVRMCFEWRLKRGGVEGRKYPIFRGGVTCGVTKWGYNFQKVGLHIRGFWGTYREGGTYHFEGV